MFKPKVIDVSNKKDLKQYIESTVTASERNMSYRAPKNPKLTELVDRYLGYVSICAKLNAQQVTQTPLYLYRPATASKRSTSFKRFTGPTGSKYLQSAMNYHDDYEVETNHPFLNTLRNPNGYQSGMQLRFQLALSNEITGNAFRYIDRDANQMHFLFPQWTRVIPNESDLQIKSKYQYGRDPANATEFSPEEIEHQILFPSLTDPYYGESWLNTIIPSADAWNFTQNFIATLMKNEGRPEHILFLEGIDSEEELRSVEATIWQRMKLAFKKGVPLVTGGSKGKPTLINFGHNPKDMGNIQLMEEMQRVISNAAGIPESILRLTESNVASAEVGEYRWIKSTILPRLFAEADSLTKTLHEMYDGVDDWFFAPDINITEDDAHESSKLSFEAYRNGIITQNEARIGMGLDQIDGGDVFVSHQEPTDDAPEETTTQSTYNKNDVSSALNSIKLMPMGLDSKDPSSRTRSWCEQLLSEWRVINPTLREDLTKIIVENGASHKDTLLFLKEKL